MFSIDGEIRMKNKENINEIAIFTVFGLICHGFKMFNLNPSFSGLYMFYAKYSKQISEGRWAAVPFMKLNGDFTLPWFSGIESVILFAVASFVVLSLYEVKHKSLRFLIAALIISSPTLCSPFSFPYMSEAFTCGLLFASLAVYVYYSLNGIKKYALFLILMTLSVGSYQVFIGYAVMLIIIYELRELMRGASILDVIKRAIVAAVISLFSMILYSIIYKLVCHFTGITLLNIMAYPRVPIQILRQIKRCYLSFFNFFFGNNIFAHIVPKTILFLELIVFLCILIYSLKKRQNNKKEMYITGLFYIAIILVIPVGCFFIHLLDMGKSYDNMIRMCVPTIPMFFLLCVLFDDVGKNIVGVDSEGNVKLFGIDAVAIRKLVIVLSAILVWFQIIVVNVSYMKDYVVYEKEYSFALRVIDRIECQDGYEPGMPVYVIGGSKNSYNGKLKGVEFGEFLKGMEGDYINVMSDSAGVKYFIEEFMQTDMDIRDTKTETVPEDIVKSLKCFPSSECISRYNNGFVIKLSDQ